MNALIVALMALVAAAQPNEPSAECQKALADCENDLECQNRLAPLMAACTTGTCQPQCRSAVLNVYQNKLGRVLLRSDASCIPGRDELHHCNFLPTGDTVHCSLSKLACEADLQCNSKFGVFISECEAEAARGTCSEKCKKLLHETTATQVGAVFSNCTCTTKDDQLCTNLRDNLLGVCFNKPKPASTTTTEDSIVDDLVGSAAHTRILLTSILLIYLLF